MDSIPGDAKSRMERIMRLQDQIDEIKVDIREIYAEEKSAGGDKTAMGNAISIIRKRAKDKVAFDDREAFVNAYLSAFDAPIGTPIASRAHASAKAVAQPQPPHATADQFSRAPVETDPLREQADVTTSGPYPREAASGDPEKVQLPNQETGCQSISPSSEASSSPLTTKADDAPPPASSAINSKPGCLKLKNGHCKISVETTALCSECNAARMKARAA